VSSPRGSQRSNLSSVCDTSRQDEGFVPQIPISGGHIDDFRLVFDVHTVHSVIIKMFLRTRPIICRGGVGGFRSSRTQTQDKRSTLCLAFLAESSSRRCRRDKSLQCRLIFPGAIWVASMSRTNVLIGVWPRRMPAELAAIYCGEHDAKAFLKRVGSEYPEPRIKEGRRRLWLKDDLDQAILPSDLRVTRDLAEDL
jgi:hypothetical protein